MDSHRRQSAEEAPPRTPKSSVLAERIGRLGTETAFAPGAFPPKPSRSGKPSATPSTRSTWATWTWPRRRTNRGGGVPRRAGRQDRLLPQRPASRSFEQALADDIRPRTACAYGRENVAIQPGGKPVIEQVPARADGPRRRGALPSPGYPDLRIQIEFLGGVAEPYGYVPGPPNFRLDVDGHRAAVTPRTRLLIFNNLPEPDGCGEPAGETARRWPSWRSSTTSTCSRTRRTATSATRARARSIASASRDARSAPSSSTRSPRSTR